VSAISLPLGALFAFYFKISKKWNCTLLAFGAGALLFALTIEIYGGAIFEYDSSNEHGIFFFSFFKSKTQIKK